MAAYYNGAVSMVSIASEAVRLYAAEVESLRAQLAKAEGGFEVRLNDDGTLDEIVGRGPGRRGTP